MDFDNLIDTFKKQKLTDDLDLDLDFDDEDNSVGIINEKHFNFSHYVRKSKNKNVNLPEINIETDDIRMILTLKEDYSKFSDSESRKKAFIEDLKELINEFAKTNECDELMAFYDFME